MSARDPGGREPGGLTNSLYRIRTRSGRRMTVVRRFAYRLAVPLARWVIVGWWRLCRVVHVEGAQHLDEALARGPTVIPCYWHQHQLFCGKFVLEQRARGLAAAWLVSPSVDGEFGAMLVRRFGGGVIRGSSTHTGARALRDYYAALTRDGLSPVITPDGPRGPRLTFKPGALLLAQMSGRPILPLAYAASRAWLVKWDRFVIPKPFARIAIAVGPPHYVARVTDPVGLERLQREMERELRRLHEAARASLGRPADSPPGSPGGP